MTILRAVLHRLGTGGCNPLCDGLRRRLRLAEFSVELLYVNDSLRGELPGALDCLMLGRRYRAGATGMNMISAYRVGSPNGPLMSWQ